MPAVDNQLIRASEYIPPRPVERRRSAPSQGNAKATMSRDEMAVALFGKPMCDAQFEQLVVSYIRDQFMDPALREATQRLGADMSRSAPAPAPAEPARARQAACPQCGGFH